MFPHITFVAKKETAGKSGLTFPVRPHREDDNGEHMRARCSKRLLPNAFPD